MAIRGSYLSGNISDNNIDSERLLSSMAGGNSNNQSLYGRPRKIWTYVFDWLLVIAFVVAFDLIDKVNGHQREFSLTDQSLMFTFAVHETVPGWLLLVAAVIIPISILVLWTLFIPPIEGIQRKRWRRGEITWREKLWDTNLTLLAIGLALASTITFTNTFKNLVGRPRPDFIDRCQPLITATNPTVFTLSNSSVCTRTDLLKDGYRSFPSGHSSLSFSGLGFLALFLAGRLSVLDTRGQVWKTVICLVPLVTAGFIAVSRLMDNRYCAQEKAANLRHHPFDVIVGSTLGFLLSWMAYRQYFPALSVAQGGRPYSIAEFATDRSERENLAYERYSGNSDGDVELGEPSQGPIAGPGRWDSLDETPSQDTSNNVKIQGSGHE